jgi:hypothetical protein
MNESTVKKEGDEPKGAGNKRERPQQGKDAPPGGVERTVTICFLFARPLRRGRVPLTIAA